MTGLRFEPKWRTIHESPGEGAGDGMVQVRADRFDGGRGSFNLRLCVAGERWWCIPIGTEESEAMAFVVALGNALGFAVEVHGPGGNAWGAP